MQSETDESNPKPLWCPLSPNERRVIGVLVEKAKTTPDAYPLSLNALRSGCNQKSNRDPQMSLEEEQIEAALDKLREKKAIAEVLGGSRVSRYRHYMKVWLGTEAEELAVVTELLLRGPQTVGELRGRAARMAKIASVQDLRPILQSLQSKGLLLSLTPEGRGQVVTHTLYPERELEIIRARFSGAGYSAPQALAEPVAHRAGHSASQILAEPVAHTPPTAQPVPSSNSGQVESLRSEVAGLREEIARLRKDVEDLWESLK